MYLHGCMPEGHDDDGYGAYEAAVIPAPESLLPIYLAAEHLGYFICPWETDRGGGFTAAVCDRQTVEPLLTDLHAVPELFKSRQVSCELAEAASLEAAVGMAFLAWHHRKRAQQIGLTLLPENGSNTF